MFSTMVSFKCVCVFQIIFQEKHFFKKKQMFCLTNISFKKKERLIPNKLAFPFEGVKKHQSVFKKTVYCPEKTRPALTTFPKTQHKNRIKQTFPKRTDQTTHSILKTKPTKVTSKKHKKQSQKKPRSRKNGKKKQ